MSLNLDHIMDEARQCPNDKADELVDRLMPARHGADDPTLSPAWQSTVARRVAEIRNGKVEGIAGDVVSARIRKIVGR
ncbi:MAG: addiction module protein [Verrucomicrobia bacterium]|nr:addiction module protein [Verrucomicrobiota bacterium]